MTEARCMTIVFKEDDKDSVTVETVNAFDDDFSLEMSVSLWNDDETQFMMTDHNVVMNATAGSDLQLGVEWAIFLTKTVLKHSKDSSKDVVLDAIMYLRQEDRWQNDKKALLTAIVQLLEAEGPNDTKLAFPLVLLGRIIKPRNVIRRWWLSHVVNSQKRWRYCIRKMHDAVMAISWEEAYVNNRSLFSCCVEAYRPSAATGTQNFSETFRSLLVNLEMHVEVTGPPGPHVPAPPGLAPVPHGPTPAGQVTGPPGPPVSAPPGPAPVPHGPGQLLCLSSSLSSATTSKSESDKGS